MGGAQLFGKTQLQIITVINRNITVLNRANSYGTGTATLCWYT